MKMKALPDLDLLNRLFELRGGELRWRCNRSFTSTNAGTLAGCVYETSTRYRYKRVKVFGVRYLVNRVVFKMTHGADPSEFVDHRDLDSLNNDPNNLRDATVAQNSMNSRKFVGVSKIKDRDGWVVRMRVDKRKVYVGYYKCFGRALKARREAEVKQFGEFSRHYAKEEQHV